MTDEAGKLANEVWRPAAQFQGRKFLDVAVKYGIRCTNVPSRGGTKLTHPGKGYDRKHVPFNLLGPGRGWMFEPLSKGM